jgi:hypothetical protein
LRAGLTKRLEEGWRVDEGEVGREVQLEYIKLDKVLAGHTNTDLESSYQLLPNRRS